MTWQEICQAIKDFFNQPVPIICCSIGTLLVFVLVIFSKTSLGKKALNTLKGLIKELTKQITDLIDKFKGFKEDVNKTLEQQNKILENALNEKQQEIDDLKALVEIIARNTHNVKSIQALEEYKRKKEVNEDGREKD